jgi:hypothetical protein
MFQPPIHRHLPRSPLDRRRDNGLHAEVTRLSTDLLRLEKNQQIQLARIAQIQQELDEIKRVLKKLAAVE